VILNDNDMSISPAVGALNRYLARLMSGRFYAAARKAGEKVLAGVPPLWNLARKMEEHAKGLVVPSTLFEEFGFNYVGPIDGHDLDSLIPDAEEHQGAERPAVPARRHQERSGLQARRGRSRALSRSGQVRSRAGHQESKRRQADLHAGVRRVAVRHGAARFASCRHHPGDAGGLGLVRFGGGISRPVFRRGHRGAAPVTFAAGLACEGLKPVLAIYSTFLQRGYDQLIHDVCIQNLPIVFALDRAGLVGGDGATHNGAFD